MLIVVHVKQKQLNVYHVITDNIWTKYNIYVRLIVMLIVQHAKQLQPIA